MFYSKFKNSEQFFDSIFLSYNKILERLHVLGITTKNGKEISELDLRSAKKLQLYY